MSACAHHGDRDSTRRGREFATRLCFAVPRRTSRRRGVAGEPAVACASHRSKGRTAGARTPMRMRNPADMSHSRTFDRVSFHFLPRLSLTLRQFAAIPIIRRARCVNRSVSLCVRWGIICRLRRNEAAAPAADRPADVGVAGARCRARRSRPAKTTCQTAAHKQVHHAKKPDSARHHKTAHKGGKKSRIAAQPKPKPAAKNKSRAPDAPPLTGDLALIRDAIDLARKGKTADATAIEAKLADHHRTKARRVVHPASP